MQTSTTDFLDAFYGQEASRYRATTSLGEFDLPEIIQIEPIHTCNLRCIMCHVSYEKLTSNKLDLSLLAKRLRGLQGKWVDIGATHEPTAHPGFSDLINAVSDVGMRISLTTNGTLCTPSLVKRIADSNFERITISFDGARKESYEYIRRNGNFDQALERISNLKASITNPSTYFAVNNTLLKSNMEEIVEAVDLWESKGFDHMGYIVMVLRDLNETIVNESLEPIMDSVYERLEQAARLVLENNYKITLSSAAFTRPLALKQQYPDQFLSNCVRSKHPKARLPFEPIGYFQNGSFPGMHVDCRSPFKAARIDFNGNVYLCQNQFLIGNIYEHDFVDLWYGEEAQRIRASLMRSPKICYACDYYRFCIRAGTVDYDEKDNFQNSILLERQPKLIEDLGPYNIVKWMDDYYGIPKVLGHVDIRIGDVEELDGVVIEKSLDALKKKLSGSEELWSQLESTQTALQQAKQELAKANKQLQNSRTKLKQTKADLRKAQRELAAISSSKFWKLRNGWFKVKGLLGLQDKS